MLRIEVEVCEQAAVVHCAGRIVQGQETVELRRAVEAQDKRSISIVLSQVSAIDAGGLGVLVDLANWADATHRHLTLVNPVRRVRELLERTKLYSVLDVSRSEAQPAA